MMALKIIGSLLGGAVAGAVYVCFLHLEVRGLTKRGSRGMSVIMGFFTRIFLSGVIFYLSALICGIAGIISCTAGFLISRNIMIGRLSRVADNADKS